MSFCRSGYFVVKTAMQLPFSAKKVNIGFGPFGVCWPFCPFSAGLNLGVVFLSAVQRFLVMMLTVVNTTV